MSARGRSGPPSRRPMARRRAMGTGTALFLIAVGAILWFAVTKGSLLGLNLHVVGVILLLIGVVGALTLVAAMMTGRSGNSRQLSRWLRPRGRDHPRLDEIKRAAAADDAKIQEDDKYFSPIPGEDDL